MESKKRSFVVAQAFSKQGSSIINSLIKDGNYHIIGLSSRDVENSAQAKKFQSQGVEIVKADFLNKEDLLRVYRDAYGVFVVRPLISPVDPEAIDKEFNSIKTQCDAAVESKVTQLIYSSTDSPASEKTQSYVNSLVSIPYVTTFFLSFFYSNCIEFSRPLKQDDGSLVFAQPFTVDTPIPYVNPYTVTGSVVSEILLNPNEYNRKEIPVVSEFLTGPQFAETFQSVTGVKATYKYQTKEDYLNDNGFNVNPQMQYIGGVIYDIWAASVSNPKAFKNATTTFSDKLNVNTRTWKQFLETTGWKGESFEEFRNKLQQ